MQENLNYDYATIERKKWEYLVEENKNLKKSLENLIEDTKNNSKKIVVVDRLEKLFNYSNHRLFNTQLYFLKEDYNKFTATYEEFFDYLDVKYEGLKLMMNNNEKIAETNKKFSQLPFWKKLFYKW